MVILVTSGNVNGYLPVRGVRHVFVNVFVLRLDVSLQAEKGLKPTESCSIKLCAQ